MWYLPPRIDPEESFNEFMEDAPRLELSDDIEALLDRTQQSLDTLKRSLETQQQSLEKYQESLFKQDRSLALQQQALDEARKEAAHRYCVISHFNPSNFNTWFKMTMQSDAIERHVAIRL